MARFLKPRFKFYKRESTNLFLKNSKFPKKKIKSIKKKIINSFSTHFSSQLKEKQKLKIIYGILEKQFSKYYLISKKIGGNLSWNIICILESRLDNFVYRIGWASTRYEAKQIVGHGCILVNYKKVDICSYLLNIGDMVQLSKKCYNQKRILDSFEYFKKSGLKPKWIFINYKNFTGYLKRYPEKDEIDYNVNDSLVFDFYSK